MINYIKNNSCRLCNSSKISNVFNLKPTPPANSFRKNTLVKNKKYPLNIFLCLNCKHLQLINVIDPKILYSNYLYSSGASNVYINHLEKYSNSLIKKYKLNKSKDLICDIASNDGTFLKFFKLKGFNVLGIEPATNIAKIANKKGIKTKNNFFNNNFLKSNKNLINTFKIITANHVFAHLKYINDFIIAINKLLKDDGIFIFEVGYLVDVLENKYFDTIYHEHLDFHHLHPLIKFFKKFDMKIIEAQRTNTQGGSIRIHVIKNSNKTIKIKSNNIKKILEIEKNKKLSLIKTYKIFFNNIEKTKNKFIKLLKNKKFKNKSIIGYGAPAKATTLLEYYEFPNNIVNIIIDDSKIKENYYMPGYDIKIKRFNFLKKINFDYIIIFAWNFNEIIIKKLKTIKNKKFKVILLFPVVKIISI